MTGCAFQGDSPSSELVLTPTEFAQRIDHLETQMAAQMTAHCQVVPRPLTAKVDAVGQLVQQLRADLEQRQSNHSEPVTVTRECVLDEELLTAKEIVGRSEWIGLPDLGTYLKARIDSGANTSSLSATDITRFERDGQDWVRFKLGLNANDVVIDAVRDQWIEAPLERRVRIVQAVGQETRPVVSLLMTLGPIRETVEFTLSDRTHLNYPVLLGRRFLMDIAIIDVAEHFLHPRPEFPGGRPATEAIGDQKNGHDEETI